MLLLAACEAAPFAPDAGPVDAGALDAGHPDAGWTRSGTVTVTIGTWNIEQFPKTATTARLVREILPKLGVDLVGIQEIAEPAAFVALDEALPGWRGIRVEEPWDFLAVGLLYRTDRIRIGSARPIFTDEPFSFPRPPLLAEATALDAAGRPVFDFDLIVVHLKALGDPRSRARRERAVERLEAFIQARIEAGGDPDVVVVGDWNDHLDDIAPENVFLPFLSQPERYRFLTAPIEEAGGSSYIPFPGLIDHIMVTADALDEYGPGETRVVPAEARFEGYLRFVSDHRPIVSTFVVR